MATRQEELDKSPLTVNQLLKAHETSADVNFSELGNAYVEVKTPSLEKETFEPQKRYFTVKMLMDVEEASNKNMEDAIASYNQNKKILEAARGVIESYRLKRPTPELVK